MKKNLKYVFIGLAGVNTALAILDIFRGGLPWLNIFFTLLFLNLAFGKKQD